MIRPVLIVLSLLFAATVFAGTFFYGPSRRVFVVPPKRELISLPAEILGHWESSGIKGRIAVVFTRRLNAEEPNTAGAAQKYLQQAMHRGIVRKVFHVVPDSSWSEVSSNLSNQRRIPSGILLLFDEGRVIVSPLSEFLQHHDKFKENMLVVLEATIWTQDELSSINQLFKEQRIVTDYFSVIRGDSSVMDMFYHNVTVSK